MGKMRQVKIQFLEHCKNEELSRKRPTWKDLAQ
jgi:hypothetical protein